MTLNRRNMIGLMAAALVVPATYAQARPRTLTGTLN